MTLLSLFPGLNWIIYSTSSGQTRDTLNLQRGERTSPIHLCTSNTIQFLLNRITFSQILLGNAHTGLHFVMLSIAAWHLLNNFSFVKLPHPYLALKAFPPAQLLRFFSFLLLYVPPSRSSLTFFTFNFKLLFFLRIQPQSNCLLVFVSLPSAVLLLQ